MGLSPKITVKHRINTSDNLPIKQRAYRVSPAERRIIHDEVGKMLDRGIIQPSESPWSSPVILTFDDHLQRLRSVLKCIQDAGLILNPKKCVFGSRQIKILGQFVSEEGIMPNPKKARAVQNFPVPKNIRDVRSFLGLCSYYRRFIKDFCLKAQPLQELLKNDSKFTWGSDQNESFEKLKRALTSEPVLGLFEAQERILTSDTEKIPSNVPAGATYNVGTDKRDTTLDSPGEIEPYRGPMTRSRTRKGKEL
ncbi:retrovirus-related Pol polyprotein from transposon 297 [Trichonephila clavata]|uniref:RNA-directed DNA polymerase n=1 Tax=Trichonephila clavata TaxID=2740835 RepID=A0A8X6KS30_TRICU|nr:retrovirus-related Pol polyprotein from transposon 297 [Trichonephila clavata]